VWRCGGGGRGGGGGGGILPSKNKENHIGYKKTSVNNIH